MLCVVRLSQASGGIHSVRFLPFHRVRELADSFGLWQHPWPRSLPSTSGLSRFVLICCRRCLRLPTALQFSGWRAHWTDVSSTVRPLHCQGCCENSCMLQVGQWVWHKDLPPLLTSCVEETLCFIFCCSSYGNWAYPELYKYQCYNQINNFCHWMMGLSCFIV